MADLIPLPGFPAGVQHLDGQSKYYMVSITSTRWGNVFAWLPEAVIMLVRSHWAPITGNVGGSLLNYLSIQASEVFGGQPITVASKRLTAQEWQGSEPLDVQL